MSDVRDSAPILGWKRVRTHGRLPEGSSLWTPTRDFDDLLLSDAEFIPSSTRDEAIALVEARHPVPHARTTRVECGTQSWPQYGQITLYVQTLGAICYADEFFLHEAPLLALHRDEGLPDDDVLEEVAQACSGGFLYKIRCRYSDEGRLTGDDANLVERDEPGGYVRIRYDTSRAKARRTRRTRDDAALAAFRANARAAARMRANWQLAAATLHQAVYAARPGLRRLGSPILARRVVESTQPESFVNYTGDDWGIARRSRVDPCALPYGYRSIALRTDTLETLYTAIQLYRDLVEPRNTRDYRRIPAFQAAFATYRELRPVLELLDPRWYGVPRSASDEDVPGDTPEARRALRDATLAFLEEELRAPKPRTRHHADTATTIAVSASRSNDPRPDRSGTAPTRRRSRCAGSSTT